MTDATAYVPVDDLIDQGIIQEANRRYFHILGLELVTVLKGDGCLSLKVRDERGVHGGLVFGHQEAEWSQVRKGRAARTSAVYSEAVKARVDRYGFERQPIDDL